jgi:hypothetical protein
LHLLTLDLSQTSTTGGNARSELGQRRPRVEFSFFWRNISYKLGLRTKTKVFESFQEHPIPNAWVDCPIRASIRGSDFKESLDGQYRITSWYNNIDFFFLHRGLWSSGLASVTWVRVSACTSVTHVVSYLPTGLAVFSGSRD